MIVAGLGLLTQPGCSRTRYRLQADRQVTALINEKSDDPRWALRNFNLGMDPRSRYFDPYNFDKEPMPPDDPASHVFMHRVDGMKGYHLWHRNGTLPDHQNPGWRDRLAMYAPMTSQGKIKLDLEGAVALAYIHSPDMRTQLEQLYLSALDVSTERFRFVTQFYGGLGPNFTESGSVASGTGSPTSVLTAGTNPIPAAPGVLALGNEAVPLPSQPGALQFEKHFATGGELLVGFANSFVWQFAGPDTNATNSLLNFNLVQPLLRSGGRAVALEQLTIAERQLLANLRAYHRYLQGFFSNIATGDNGNVTGPQRVGGFAGGTGLTGFSGQGSGGLGGVGTATNFGRAGFGAPTNVTGAVATGTGFAGGGAGAIGGFAGLLQQLQQIRNTQLSLSLQLRTLALLEANLEAGTIDITQVDTFRQNIETERANLLQSQIALDNSVDTFLRQILGLPPDLPIELDDSMINQFQLIDPKIRDAEDKIADYIAELGKSAAEPSEELLERAFDALGKLRPLIEEEFKAVENDLQRMDDASEARFKMLSAEERVTFESDRQELLRNLVALNQRFGTGSLDLEKLHDQLATQPRGVTANALVALAGALNTLAQELSLVQARARLEAVTIEPVDLNSVQALRIAEAYRQDWMNNKATVVNTWRLITFNANALRSAVTVTFNGTLGTVGNNPVAFNSTDGTLSAGLRFDPPFTRLLERNNYRQSLISYQSDRRTLIQFIDSINQTLRQDLRLLRQYQVGLEIQRRAVAIAVRRVDKCLEDLNAPPPAVEPGQVAVQFGPTAAFNLLTAISDMRNAQNNFLSVWLNFYQQRMELDTDLGILELDERGMWITKSLEHAMAAMPKPEPLPPPIPDEWFQDAGLSPPPKDGSEESLPAPFRSQPLPLENSGEHSQPDTVPSPAPDEPLPAIKPLGGSNEQRGPKVLRLAGEDEKPDTSVEDEPLPSTSRPARLPLPGKQAVLERN
ncbi:MAG TPA: hypothetical protein VHY20_00475 [Pirellulales bacterium]|nr:hypothetical protein [Pirellulales bacterium]